MLLNKAKCKSAPGSGVKHTQLQGEAWIRHTLFLLGQLVRCDLRIVKLAKAWYLEVHFSIIRGETVHPALHHCHLMPLSSVLPLL